MTKPLANWSFHALKEFVLNAPTYNWGGEVLPVSILSTFHAIRGALFFRYLLAPGNKSTNPVTHVPWLQGLITNLVVSLGGGILTGLLFGRHIPWLASNSVLPLYSSIHLLVMYSPLDVMFKFLHGFRYIINPLLVVADGVSCGFALISSIDYIRVSAPEALRSSYVAMLLAGVAASNGGGIIVSTLGMGNLEWRLQTPAFVKKVPFNMKVSFFLSLAYVTTSIPELPIRHLIKLLLSIAPKLFRPIEWIVIEDLGRLELTDAQAGICMLYSLALLFDEYFLGPRFYFSDITSNDFEESHSDILNSGDGGSDSESESRARSISHVSSVSGNRRTYSSLDKKDE